MEIVEDTSIPPGPVVGVVSGWELEEDWDGEDAGDMPYDIAWQLIEQTIARFRGGDLPYVKGRSL